ncbi:hypothetical protein QRX60_30605 [Amycolatopsis mongoliensis]|uniref:Uncharacterized protein n=1 Tax=Amycolatopsis mongoliensis TaxID=715475 RepID=A0A9Y2JGW8_9PSEU|nr:hypothetical protein [Amycolatopsis sp. 4-36]WIX98405.1 hypothetical protein QRX60_30605 [Amycolatopsis sp. 4-36]
MVTSGRDKTMSKHDERMLRRARADADSAHMLADFAHTSAQDAAAKARRARASKPQRPSGAGPYGLPRSWPGQRITTMNPYDLLGALRPGDFKATQDSAQQHEAKARHNQALAQAYERTARRAEPSALPDARDWLADLTGSRLHGPGTGGVQQAVSNYRSAAEKWKAAGHEWSKAALVWQIGA